MFNLPRLREPPADRKLLVKQKKIRGLIRFPSRVKMEKHRKLLDVDLKPDTKLLDEGLVSFYRYLTPC